MPDRLLLVEDTASLSMVYQSVLTKAGHKVICAFSLAASPDTSPPSVPAGTAMPCITKST